MRLQPWSRGERISCRLEALSHSAWTLRMFAEMVECLQRPRSQTSAHYPGFTVIDSIGDGGMFCLF